MTKLLRTRFVFLVIAGCLSSTALMASDDAIRPSQFNLRIFLKASIEIFGGKKNHAKLDEIVTNIEKKRMDRVCVCEIVSLQNNNQSYTDVALFAERTISEEIGKDYKVAEKQIIREKKQLKAKFFDSVKVDQKVAAASDCYSLYLVLKQKKTDLKLYDVLDADAR